MKRFLLLSLLLTLTGLMAQAQYIKRAGCSIKMDGEKLSREQTDLLLSDIGGEDLRNDWKTAKGWRTAGIALTATGGTAIVAGAGTVMIGALTSALGATAGAIAGGTAGAISGDKDASQKAANDAAKQGAQAGTPIMNGGLACMIAGTVALAAGIPLIVVNCKRMNGIVKRHNELIIGPAQEGVGVAMRF